MVVATFRYRFVNYVVLAICCNLEACALGAHFFPNHMHCNDKVGSIPNNWRPGQMPRVVLIRRPASSLFPSAAELVTTMGPTLIPRFTPGQFASLV
jgi:hypothetical protein